MRVRFALLICSTALLPSAAPVRADDALTRTPIDRSLFREGEVRRDETRFGGWLLTCDAVRRLGQKFCSMRTVARAADGTVIAAITVSTDEAGRPAAIVTLPYGTALTGGIRLTVENAPHPPRQVASWLLQPSRCDDLGCEAVWPLGAAVIRHLRIGKPVTLAFERRLSASFDEFDMRRGMAPVRGAIDGAGFSAALAASLR